MAPGLPDSPVARLLRKPATLDGEATLDDGGLLTVKSLALAVGPVTVAATGRYDARQDTLEATTTLTAAEPGPLADLVGGTVWRNLHLEAKTALTGVSRRPRGTVTIAGAADDLAAAGLGGKAPPPGPVDLAADIGLEPGGRIVVRSFETHSPLVGLRGSADYTPASQATNARLAIDLGDFAAFSALAGLPLGGRGHLDLVLAASPGTAKLDWQGALDDLDVPDLPPDLQSRTVKLAGGGTLRQGRSWRLDGVKFVADAFTLALSGRGRDRASAFDFDLDMPRLGTMRLALGLDARPGRHEGDDQGRWHAGSSRPLRLLTGSFRQQGRGVSVPAVQGSWASASIDVKDLAVTPGGATGSGHLGIAHLEDLKDLLGADLAGAIDLDVATSDDPAGKLTLSLRGDRLRNGPTGVGSLQVDAAVADPLGAARIEATLKAERLSGVPDIAQVSATLKGDRSAVDVGLKVAGAANASVQARVEPTAEGIRIALEKLDARYEDPWLPSTRRRV